MTIKPEPTVEDQKIEAALAEHKPEWAESGGFDSVDANDNPMASWQSKTIKNKPGEAEYELAMFREDTLIDGQVVEGEAEMCVWIGRADALRFKDSKSIWQAAEAMFQARYLMEEIDGTHAAKDAALKEMDAEQEKVESVDCGIEGCDRTYHEAGVPQEKWLHQIPAAGFPDFVEVSAVIHSDGHKSASVFFDVERDNMTSKDVWEFQNQLGDVAYKLAGFSVEAF